ncbi:hypothetical protein A9K55_005187 [Cordyceps militaris]|uniref:Uncharacterized protein n=1 Tax=Cordyceps militaris TaxID=73501 RepID=A0A2H4SNK6_CORMI|nr:hypothetical protein A9K55_005187 [Cordyceps militaris]
MLRQQQNPIVFIACIVGMALLATVVWLCFYLLRRRFRRGTKPYDAEQPLGYLDVAPPDHRRRHPPVYCVDDLGCPPPSYQAAVTRAAAAPTPLEMHTLRRRLEKLQRRRRRRRTAIDVTPAETALRDAEIRDLARWIDRWETMLGDHDAPPAADRRWARRLVLSQSAVQFSPARRGHVLQRSATDPGTGLCCAGSRHVAPPWTPASSPIEGDMDLRVAVLREQLMRSVESRHSAEQ